MPIRRGRPGLIGTMARTAVISGTATAVSNNVNRRQYQRQASRVAQSPPPPVAPAAPAAPPDAGRDDLVAQLQRLGDLKAAGILDDSEFAAAKAKLLG